MHIHNTDKHMHPRHKPGTLLQLIAHLLNESATVLTPS